LKGVCLGVCAGANGGALHDDTYDEEKKRSMEDKKLWLGAFAIGIISP
jgi:hypothetical protein